MWNASDTVICSRAAVRLSIAGSGSGPVDYTRRSGQGGRDWFAHCNESADRADRTTAGNDMGINTCGICGRRYPARQPRFALRLRWDTARRKPCPPVAAGRMSRSAACFMIATADIESFVAAQPWEDDPTPVISRISATLRGAFGTPFTFWDGQTGELLYASTQQPASSDPFRGQLARAIHGSEPQFISDEDCVLLLAVPLPLAPDRSTVATSAFVVRPVAAHEHLSGPSHLLGLDP